MGNIKFIDPNKKSFPGGHLSFFIIRESDVISIPDPVDHQITSALTLKGGSGFSRWNFSPASMKFKQSERSSPHGTIYQVTIELFIPGDTLENSLTFEELRGPARVISIIQTNNSEMKLIGEIDNPARVTFQTERAPGGTGQVGTTVQLSWESLHRAYFYKASVGVLLPISVWIDVDGNLWYNNDDDPTISFTLDGAGDLTITGPAASQYSIDGDGNLIFTP